MVPPRVPQFNWIDLGLPSGTLWLDRMVGAPSPTDRGLFYQWGDTIGHSLAEGYNFSLDNYTEKGLDLISTDLDDAHDAARAYYGPEAKMPSVSQFEELKSNCVVSYQGNGVYLLTSNINGHSIKIRGDGHVTGLDQHMRNQLRSWTKTVYIENLEDAYSFLANENSAEILSNGHRYVGVNVMAVHA